MRRISAISMLVAIVACAPAGDPAPDVASSVPGAGASPAALAALARLRAVPDALARAAGAPLVTSLDRDGAWLSPRAAGGDLAPAIVRWSASADGASRIEDRASGVAVEVRLEGASAQAAELADGVVVYPGGGPDGADLSRLLLPGGAEEIVLFRRPPARPRARHVLSLGEGVGGLRLVSGTLEVLDAAGAPRLRAAPPYLIDARGARVSARFDVSRCAFDTDPRGPWQRPLTPPGARQCDLDVVWRDDVEMAYPVALDPVWTSTKDLAFARRHHQAVELTTGQVLVAGGWSSVGGQDGVPGGLREAELFDPVTATWGMAPPMAAKRDHAAAVALGTGMVLVAGGAAAGDGAQGVSQPTLTAELYDPASGTWSVTAPMAFTRAGHVATLLATGEVLVAGGRRCQGGMCATTVATPTAELYDPLAAPPKWTSTGNDVAARVFQVATVLEPPHPLGQVLVVGGQVPVGSGQPPAQTNTWLRTASVYDRATQTFTAVAPMANARWRHSIARLPGAGALVVGGGDLLSLYDAERYDVLADAWSPAGAMSYLRTSCGAVLLPSGNVLVAFGQDSVGPIGSVEVYDPLTDAWTPITAPVNGRVWGTTTLLTQSLLAGSVLAAGGAGGVFPLSTVDLASAEIYTPGAPGAACGSGLECASGSCTDGVCCDAPCTGACDVCVAALGAPADGACTVLPLGTPGSPACPGHLVCDGASGACPAACATDASCKIVYYCQGGACFPDLADGAPCASASQCTSGACADGVCCDEDCSGVCEACTAALTGAVDGVCAEVDSGTAGQGCPDEGPESCKRDGACGPGKTCLYYAAGTSCGADKCFQATATSYACDGAGVCQSSPVDCGDYGCSGGACQVACATTSGCSPLGYCEAGVCLHRKVQGDACAGDDQCASDHCADGVCCDGACDGRCEACAEASYVGTCVPVRGAPRGERPACPRGPEGEPCSSTTCDGNDHDACHPVADDTPCGVGRCDDGVPTPPGLCDGQGACVQQAGPSCAPLACAFGHCGAEACAGDGDCAAGHFCFEGACTKGPVCDDHVIRTLAGAEDCSPYRCEAADKCKRFCASVRDCVDGSVCGLDAHCVPGPGAPATAGCTTGGGAPAGPGWLLLGLAASVARLRARSGRRAWAPPRTGTSPRGARPRTCQCRPSTR